MQLDFSSGQAKRIDVQNRLRAAPGWACLWRGFAGLVRDRKPHAALDQWQCGTAAGTRHAARTGGDFGNRIVHASHNVATDDVRLVETAIAAAGLERRVVVSTSHLFIALDVLMRSDTLMLGPEYLSAGPAFIDELGGVMRLVQIISLSV